MKLILTPATTSVICHVFIPDSTSTTGAGKTALAFGDITAYYVRAGGTLTALTMVDVTTLGTWDSDVTSDKLGFKKLDDTNAPGLYEVHLPDNILAAGSNQVVIQMRATGAAPTMIEIQLLAVPSNVTAWLGTAAATPTVAGVPEVDVTHMAGGTQTVTDLKDFADTGYDPSAHKVAGVVLVDTTTTATTATNLTNAPSNGDFTSTMKTSLNAATPAVTITDSSSDAVIADAVWNAATASYGTSNTYGALIESGNVGGGAIVAASVTGAVGSVTGNVGGSVASVTGAVGSVTGAVGSVTGAVGSVTGNVGGSVASVTGAVGSVTGNVGGNVTGSVGSLATQAKADVNAEVVDAIYTDTYAEPGQGAPAATASLAAKINYMYKSWRNKKTQTATTRSIYNDAGDTVDHKATDSDDGTTFTKGEIGTGA